MSKRILITFGGHAYDKQIERQRLELRSLGIEHRVYDDNWLVRSLFFEQNRWIFERNPNHGFGFCSWKPYIILDALERLAEPGDVVMYLDGDTYPVADISCLFEMAEREGIVVFEEQGCVNKTWIKYDCFKAMGVNGLAWDAMHACGRFQLFRKGDYRNVQFLQEWQTYSLNPECQFHEGSKAETAWLDHSSFIRNSCEQSVLSLLAHKYAIPLHRTPDQNGWPVAHNGTYKPDDKYPQLLIQDGSRGDVNDLSGSRFRNVD